jgi:methyl coenzyme M reductase subunit D
MRTSLLDIARLAWTLYRHPHRKHLRIGQIVVNATVRVGRDAFYVENSELVEHINKCRGSWLAQRS